MFEELRKSVFIEQYDGSQKVTDHKLVIFDGDAHTPEEIKNHEAIAEALREGLWVLAVDVTEAHKKEGLGSRILSLPRGPAPAIWCAC